MGHITDPALLLLLLGFEGLAALDQHQQAFIATRQNDGLQRIPLLLPFTSLGALLIAAAEDHLLKCGNIQGIPEVHATNQTIAGNVQQTFGPTVDVGDGVIRSQDQPALGGRINPGEKLRCVQGKRLLLLLSHGRSESPSTLQQKRDPDAGRKAQYPRDQHNKISRSGNRSRGPCGSTGEMRAHPRPFPVTNGCEHPRSWCRRQNQHPRFSPAIDRDSRRAWGSE